MTDVGERIEELRDSGLFRRLRLVSGPQGPRVILDGKPVLLLTGSGDRMIPAAKAQRLAEELSVRGATVEHRSVPGGHGLSAQDVDLARDWLARHTGGLAS